MDRCVSAQPSWEGEAPGEPSADAGSAGASPSQDRAKVSRITTTRRNAVKRVAEDVPIMKPVNRLHAIPEFRDLFPATKLDRLFSAEDRRLFEHRASPSFPQPPHTVFEALKQLGRFVDETTPREQLDAEYYPMFYKMARTQLRNGVSPDHFRALLSSLAESDVELVAVARQAIGDALAGRAQK